MYNIGRHYSTIFVRYIQPIYSNITNSKHRIKHSKANISLICTYSSSKGLFAEKGPGRIFKFIIV